MDVITFVFIAVLLSLIYVLWQQIRQQKKSQPKLDRSLEGKLLGMISGDKKVALRLLRHARRNNPGRSYLWYYEKVIRDLERDRRY